MSLQNLTRFPRLEFIGAPTPLEFLPRFSDYLGRDIFIKRDDVTPMAMGGNKLRKLEFLAADALREGADTLITAGAIQSNHVRQTAAVAAKLGLHCVALLENPIGTQAENYLTNGNRLLLDLFNVQVEMVDALTDPAAQLEDLATRLEAQGFRPYVIPVGGSNALGALGYVESALEIAQQCEGAVSLSSVVVASGSAGTHAGLAVGLERLMPEVELIGVTVSRSVADQKPKVVTLQQAVAEQLALQAKAVFESLDVEWDKNHPLLLGVAKGADRKAGLETLFFEPEGEGFSLPPDSPALHVIQHIRDESHDHAISGHRKKRAKVKNTSTLETIEGVGPKRRQMLLKYMGGLQGLLNASMEEIAKVPGISQGLAEKIYYSLKH